eukprot:c4538_g1_i2.p1 GENE.c4538_g1_i2~~c4538_g1_i2.p1  ORF type:complete len:268 (+),score=55.85 c4538_g1_i2:29-805(+)
MMRVVVVALLSLLVVAVPRRLDTNNFLSEADLVNVEFYGEALCPNCKDFINQALNKTLSIHGIWDIVNFTMVPWGNAYFNTSKCGQAFYDKSIMFCWIDQCGLNAPQPLADDCFAGTILCQHGPTECEGNTILACAVAANPPQIYVPFTHCFEGQHNADKSKGEACAREAGVDWNVITACVASGRGDELILQNAHRTISLGSAKAGVPWVVVNGVPLENVDDLLPTICSQYQGPRPAFCSSALASFIQGVPHFPSKRS